MKKNKNKKSIILLAAIVVAVIVLFITFSFFYQNQLQPVSSVSDSRVFTISEGESADTVLSNLKEEGFIKSDFIAKMEMRKQDLSDLKAGSYLLDSSWDTVTILSYMNDSANILAEDQVLITIPEGTWAKDIAELIAEQTNVTADELLALWNDTDFLYEMMDTYEFLDESILNDAYPVKLEGYLYPETYYFYRETTARDVTLRFLEEFNNHYLELKDKFDASAYTPHEIVTMASLIQFESGSLDEMKLIAGVFENRMEQGMMLQASATVCYAMYEFDDITECEANPDYESPYNTYLYPGLPIGPISNPGLHAIEAALEPAETDYLYFVHDIYGTGEAHFAVTYEEHLANVEKYLN